MSKKRHDNTKYTYEEVKAYFEKYGCTLLDKEYINARTPMRYLCSCGNESSNTISKFKANKAKGCRKCAQLKLKGINDITTKNYNKEDLIEEFWRFHKENGRYPKSIDMKTENGYPPHYLYYKEFGGWNNFLKNIVCIMGDSNWYICDEQVLLDMYETEPDRDKIIDSLMVRRKWDAVIVKASSMGLSRDARVGRGKEKITKKYLIEKFWDFYKKNKRYPLAFDFHNNKDYPHYSYYSRIFGSWDNFLKYIGVVRKETNDGWYKCDEEIIEKYYPMGKKDAIMSNLMVKRGWLTILAKANSMGLYINKDIRYKRKYDNDETRRALKTEAIEFYNKFGRSPFKNELSLPRNAIETNWNTYNDFLNECNLPINTNMFSIGFWNEDKSEYFRSKTEYEITNILNQNKIEYINEPYYSKVIKNINERIKFDWYLVEYDAYIEFFGLFIEDKINSNCKIGEYTRNAIKKINLCKENNISLICLYPEDLDHNYRGMINKFKLNGIILDVVA